MKSHIRGRTLALLLLLLGMFSTQALGQSVGPQACSNWFQRLFHFKKIKNKNDEIVLMDLSARLERRLGFPVTVDWSKDMPSVIRVLNQEGKSLGSIKYHIDGEDMAIDFIFVSYQKKGISEELFRSLSIGHPEVKRVHTSLTLDNNKILNDSLSGGLSCVEAIRSTPAYKIRAKAGFRLMLPVDCAGGGFIMERDY